MTTSYSRRAIPRSEAAEDVLGPATVDLYNRSVPQPVVNLPAENTKPEPEQKPEVCGTPGVPITVLFDDGEVLTVIPLSHFPIMGTVTDHAGRLRLRRAIRVIETS